MLSATPGLGAQERVSSQFQPLAISNVRNWTANGNQVPVCWQTPGNDREKAIVREAVRNTWEFFANVQFTGWEACPAGGALFGSDSARQVRIRIAPGTSTGAAGAARLGMEALSSASDNDPGVDFTFNANGRTRREVVEQVGVHEFGHVLGFDHEQDTPGNVRGPDFCPTGGVDPNLTPLTPYDRNSIMNYCRDPSLRGNLTDSDIRGVQAVYGVRVPFVPSRNSCASALARRQSTGRRLTAAHWATRAAAWRDTATWCSGQF